MRSFSSFAKCKKKYCRTFKSPGQSKIKKCILYLIGTELISRSLASFGKYTSLQLNKELKNISKLNVGTSHRNVKSKASCIVLVISQNARNNSSRTFKSFSGQSNKSKNILGHISTELITKGIGFFGT